MKKIGLCGTGKMGKAIGTRLIEKKYNLSIWNRTKSNSEDLIKSGGKFFKKVSELVDEVDIIIVILGNDDCLLYTSPSPRDGSISRMPSSA